MIRERVIYKFSAFLLLFFCCLQKVSAAPLRLVGSSAVFPFAVTVAEHFHHKTHMATPLIEATGTGAGIKLFCSSLVGPDGVMTSRSFTQGEREKCALGGVKFDEFKIGQDGLVLIQNKREKSFSLTLSDLNKAFAEMVFRDGKCVSNPNKIWKDVDVKFPDHNIYVLGPAPASGTYDVLTEKIQSECGPYVRRDGAYVPASSNENVIVQKVLNDSATIGIVTFSFYDQNKERLQALSVDGILPSSLTIQAEVYPLSRPLFLYMKTNGIASHPMRSAYVLEFTSENAIGEKGYLKEKGLIPLSLKEQAEMQNRAQRLGDKT